MYKVNIVNSLTILISDLSTDLTVIASVNDGACATRTVPIETEAATPSVCLFKRLQLVESSAGTRTACSALLPTLWERTERERESTRLKEAAPQATPLALVHPLSQSLSLSLFVLVRAENACCDRLTLTYDCLSLSLSSLLLMALYVNVCVCLCIALGQVFVLFCFYYRFSVVFVAVVVSLSFLQSCLLLKPVMKALTKQLPGWVSRSNWLIFHDTRQCTAVKGLFYEFGNSNMG